MNLFKETTTERWLSFAELTSRGYRFYCADGEHSIYQSPTRANVYYALEQGGTEARQVTPKKGAWTNAARPTAKRKARHG